MRVCLINPPLISQRNDPHTGIIFMPFMLAYLSAYLKQQGHTVSVIDALGLAPARFRQFEDRQIQGLDFRQILQCTPSDTQAVVIHFIGISAFRAVMELAALLKSERPEAKLLLLENAQAVTSISLRHDPEQFLRAGYHVLLTGDAEVVTDLTLRALEAGLPLPQHSSLTYLRADGQISTGTNFAWDRDLDSLPFPDWQAFPLRNYWDLSYAHGPMEGKYLPLLTSRGCPVPCRFCVIPATNERRWRPRSPINVVDEIEYWGKTLGVFEFHIEDVNPTVKDSRMVQISTEIARRGLAVKWKFASGTKIETMRIETIGIMARSGCSYISFSPETGSPELLKKINKPFNYDLAAEMVREMHHLGVRSQACFVLGFPGEGQNDWNLTRKYIRRLVRAGLDEIAQFIITPIPGSAIFEQYSGYANYSQLTFSPHWRSDYRKLSRRRLMLYLEFLILQAFLHPRKFSRTLRGVLVGRFQTKMEQALYRVTVWPLRRIFGRLPAALFGRESLDPS